VSKLLAFVEEAQAKNTDLYGFINLNEYIKNRIFETFKFTEKRLFKRIIF